LSIYANPLSEPTIESAFIVITKESLNSEFNINKSGDRLKLVTYSGYSTSNVLTFGNRPGATIDVFILTV
jgi:hypothetical protein